MRQRLDSLLVALGLFESRRRAQTAIAAGSVSVNGQTALSPDKKFEETDKIEISGPACPYVSRGGLKLKSGLDSFKVSPAGKLCMDLGAATGGFTDCFLQEGADAVYAIDVGQGQLHESLLKNPKVIFMPDTNARYLNPSAFKNKPQVCAIDVSFISLKMVLPAVSGCLENKADIIALIKPQFELSRRELVRGIVKDPALHEKVKQELQSFLKTELPTAKDLGIIPSPIEGAHGNTEFLWHIRTASA
ncbi:MAG: TlyA family RNA methyltransferase [Elusimicrobiaceae bacterium]|jgi:23S rRNA (cytidine1920-2'-O)/16S rRNA (cytidine1409-2'-O)-methyltransferase